VTVNGQAVPTSGGGRFSAVLTLFPGPNTIRVTAARRYSYPAVVERRVFVTAGASSETLLDTGLVLSRTAASP
jgi:hypothetical protein